MRTPVDELFELLWDTPKDKFTWYAIRKRMIEKERNAIVSAFSWGNIVKNQYGNFIAGEEYYEQTFNTKEK